MKKDAGKTQFCSSPAAAIAVAVSTTGCPHPTEMAPPDHRAPDGQPPADDAARAPEQKVEPYDEEETRWIEMNLQAFYGGEVARLGRGQDGDVLAITLSLELNEKGEVVKVSARGDNEVAAREVEKMAKGWTVRKVKRAGTCTVKLYGMVPQIFELAPSER